MADYPALPLWTDAYLADTLDLSDAEHGTLLMMLMVAWRRPDCALPNDMGWLKRSLAACFSNGMHGNTFNARVPQLLERFWYLADDGKWHQKRLDKERAYLVQRSRVQSERARKRWSNGANGAENDLKTDSNQVENEFKSKTNGSENEPDFNDFNGLADAEAMPPHPHPHPHIKKEEIPSVSPRKKADAAPAARPNGEVVSEVIEPPPRTKRGHRLPDDWEPSLTDIGYARQQGFTVSETDRIAIDFREYWLAKAGRDATKLDWSLTWRRWVRHEMERRARPANGGGQRPSRAREAAEFLYEQGVLNDFGHFEEASGMSHDFSNVRRQIKAGA